MYMLAVKVAESPEKTQAGRCSPSRQVQSSILHPASEIQQQVQAGPRGETKREVAESAGKTQVQQ